MRHKPSLQQRLRNMCKEQILAPIAVDTGSSNFSALFILIFPADGLENVPQQLHPINWSIGQVLHFEGTYLHDQALLHDLTDTDPFTEKGILLFLDARRIILDQDGQRFELEFGE